MIWCKSFDCLINFIEGLILIKTRILSLTLWLDRVKKMPELVGCCHLRRNI